MLTGTSLKFSGLSIIVLYCEIIDVKITMASGNLLILNF